MSTSIASRSDIVIVDFRPFVPNAGVRPALVVQNDQYNIRMNNTIVAQVTTNTRRIGEQTQLLVDPSHPDWASSGLHRPSAINCANLYTIEQQDIARIIGALSAGTMLQIDDCLKAALGIS